MSLKTVFGAGKYDLLGGTMPKPESWGVWTVDLNGGTPKVEKLVDMPEIGLINGMTTWDENTVLVTDCFGGKIYKVDVGSRTYSCVLEDETMAAPPNATSPTAINGIKVYRAPFQDYIYYTNTVRKAVFRIPVDSETIKATGPAEKLAEGFNMDDLAVAVGLGLRNGRRLWKKRKGSIYLDRWRTRVAYQADRAR